MAWTIKYTDTAKKQLRKLEKGAAKRIVNYLDSRIATQPNPRTSAKALRGELGDFWRFRIGDFRVICTIEDEELTVLVVRIGHRKNIYQ